MKILMLEDSENDALLMRPFFPIGAELTIVNTKEDFIAATDKECDIVIVDFSIPGWSGVSAAEVVRKKRPDIPVLILSGTIEDHIIPTLEEKMIDDVVLKDRPHRLAWAIRKAIRDKDREKRERIAHQEALEAQRMAMEAQRTALVGEVATGIAHDMRNMLTPIMGFLHLIESNTPADRLNLLKGAQKSADRMVDMINRMMLFVSGKNGYKDQVSFRQVVLEFFQFLPGLLPGVSLKAEVTTSSVMAIDPTVIRQIILNFCVNARDAGGLNLLVSASDVTVNGEPHCVISVKDDGSGVNPEIADRIFDPFFTTKPVGKGTGLGLSTVRNIVYHLGGFVKVEAVEPHGSIFSAYLLIR